MQYEMRKRKIRGQARGCGLQIIKGLFWGKWAFRSSRRGPAMLEISWINVIASWLSPFLFFFF